MTIFDTCYTLLRDWRQSGRIKLWINGIMIKNINLLTTEQYNQYKGVIEPLKQEWTWLDNDDILTTELSITREKGCDGFMLYSYDSFHNEDNREEVENVIRYLNE